MVQINPSSFINLFPSIIYDMEKNSQLSLDIWNSYQIVSTPNDPISNVYVGYKVQRDDTIYTIAYNYYKDQNLWWLVLLANDAQDPFDFIEQVLEGEYGKDSVIRLLNRIYVTDILYNLKRIKSTNDNIKEINDRSK